jgi:hydrogenase nickel incorporation protein HypA/HybF
MHELSIALSIIDVAAEELDRQGGGQVAAVYLRLGPLSGVLKEALLSAWELACEQSPLAGANLRIEEVPVEIDCPVCDVPRPVDSPQEMRCTVCGTPCAAVVHGRELDIRALEIINDHPAAIG